jgi:hypothetical protein
LTQVNRPAADSPEDRAYLAMRWSIAVSSAAALLLASCQSNPRADSRDGDPELFSSEIQPILAEHCAYLGCHGREGMPLTVYAVDYLRLRDPEGRVDPSRPPLDERALTPAELEWNRRALAVRVGPRDPQADRDRFLRRLLPVSAGGIPHAGVEVFAGESDPQLDALRRFLETVE